MAHFTAERHATAVITASRQQVWEVLTDPALLAKLTPMLSRIEADGDRWTWHLSGLEVLGHSVAPVFTEKMTFDEPSRIDFVHDDADDDERAGVEGWYDLQEAEQGTRLETRLAITLDLPLPKVSGPAVRSTMEQVVKGMGERFSRNLLQHLGAEEVS